MKELLLIVIMLAAMISCEQLVTIKKQLIIDCSSRPNCQQAMEVEAQRIADEKVAEEARKAAEQKGRAKQTFKDFGQVQGNIRFEVLALWQLKSSYGS